MQDSKALLYLVLSIIKGLSCLYFAILVQTSVVPEVGVLQISVCLLLKITGGQRQSCRGPTRGSCNGRFCAGQWVSWTPWCKLGPRGIVGAGGARTPGVQCPGEQLDPGGRMCARRHCENPQRRRGKRPRSRTHLACQAWRWCGTLV